MEKFSKTMIWLYRFGAVLFMALSVYSFCKDDFLKAIIMWGFYLYQMQNIQIEKQYLKIEKLRDNISTIISILDDLVKNK